MSPLFKKLNLKDQREMVVFNPPASFEPELKGLGISVLRNPKKPKAVTFALAFATRQAELDNLSNILASAAQGDALLWFAYPKGTSKRYQCDFNRDSGWTVIRSAGFESVRMVAIDADWSAVRFRRLNFIKPSK
jgi:hypothetical protein